jgi:SAM-dependent methyltransferase
VPESQYYENAELWSQSRFATGDEQERFTITSDLIPASVQSMLDLGCGNGAFLAFLEAHGVSFNLMGLERSQAARRAKVCQAEILDGSIDNLPFGEASFDLVAAMEVIEHLPYGVYEQSLQEIQRVAGRHVLISVPYKEKRQFVECPYCHCRFDPNYHMRSFDEATLEGIFPAFRLTKLEKVAIDDYVFAPIMRSAYRLLSHGRDFPRTALCPNCNFTGKNDDNRTLSAAPHRVRSRLRDTWKSKLPKYKRFNWFVALYERKI